MKLIGRKRTIRPQATVTVEDGETVIDLREPAAPVCPACRSEARDDGIDPVSRLHALTCLGCGFSWSARV